MGNGPQARPMELARRIIPFAGAAVAVVLVGFLDIATGPQIGMSLFYLLPISVTAWSLGRWPGVAIAVLAAAAWLFSDASTQPEPVSASGWNAFTRLVIFSTIAVMLDIVRRDRERLRATVRRLDEEYARQGALIAALADPILVVDEDGRISSTNARADELFGRRSLLGRAVDDVLPFLTGDRPARNVRWTGRVADPFGQTVEVEVSRASLGEPTATRVAVYVIHDITQHAELNRMREQLLYNVAHELRGPLGVLENALDLLANEYGELSAEEFGRLSGSALRTAKRLHTLMEDLLSAGSIQSGRFTIAPEALRVRALIEDAAETVELALAERRQRLDVDLPTDGLAVRADPRYARQVLTNLLANASKYAPHGTHITVRAMPGDGEVRISVQDRGPGIPADQIGGLFERFYRVRRDAAEPGIGLGLAIAKGIVEAHAGRMGIESEAGRGTTVWFTMPSAPEAVAA